MARVKEENAVQLATIKRQDWRIKNRSIQMRFRDSEVTTDTDNDSGQRGQKRKGQKMTDDIGLRRSGLK